MTLKFILAFWNPVSANILTFFLKFFFFRISLFSYYMEIWSFTKISSVIPCLCLFSYFFWVSENSSCVTHLGICVEYSHFVCFPLCFEGECHRRRHLEFMAVRVKICFSSSSPIYTLTCVFVFENISSLWYSPWNLGKKLKQKCCLFGDIISSNEIALMT